MLFIRRRWASPLGVLLFLAALGPARADGSSECLTCHSPSTSARPAAGGSGKLSVDPEVFARSVHGRLDCVVCHGKSYRTTPHPKATAPIHCLSCHGRNEDAPEGVRFADIEAEFHQSVHVQRHPGAFTCASCHDPHTFRLWRGASPEAIAERNGVCLACHRSEARFSQIAGRAPADLDQVHSWLPHHEVHWQHARCIDCHSSYEGTSQSHNLLPKSQAVRNCVDCHSANSLLKLKLYRYERREETARLGFANAAIVNNAYVIGATRNRFLDGAALLAILAAICGASAHGMLRVWAARRRVGRGGSRG